MKRKKKVKPFKNPNSSLFQNKTSGIHHSNYHKVVWDSDYYCFLDVRVYPKTLVEYTKKIQWYKA